MGRDSERQCRELKSKTVQNIYYYTSENGEWILIKGETDKVLRIFASEDNFGWQFRCKASNGDGSTYSKIATLMQK